MKRIPLYILLMALIFVACKAAPTTQPISEWQAFTNPEAGYSLQAPTNWSQAALPDQADGQLHGVAYTGPEGGVEVYWGAAFGGACTTGTEQVKLAAGEVSACHATKSDGTEEWSQIAYQNSGIDYSLRAYTSNKQATSHDLVLQVLSTVNFMPAQTTQPISEWQTFTNTDAGYSLQAPTTWSEQALPDQADGQLHGDGIHRSRRWGGDLLGHRVWWRLPDGNRAGEIGCGRRFSLPHDEKRWDRGVEPDRLPGDRRQRFLPAGIHQ